MLSIARAIVEERRLLLIDEPTIGLSPAIVGALIECLREIARDGATIPLVEQNFRVAQKSATRCMSWIPGASSIPARWRSLPPTTDFSTRLLGLTGQPSMSAVEAPPTISALPAATEDRLHLPILLLFLLLLSSRYPLIGSFSTWTTLTLAGAGDGHDDFRHGVRPHARLRPDGRDELSATAPSLAVAYLAMIAFAPMARLRAIDGRPQPGAVPALAGDVCGGGGLRVRTPSGAAGLRPAPQADPHHHGRLIVAEQLLYASFGPQINPPPRPPPLSALDSIQRSAVRKYRLLAVVVGPRSFRALQFT